MTGFWIAAVVMTAAVLGVVLAPLIRRSAKRPPGRGVYDLNVYKDQLDEVARDRVLGLLDEAEAEAATVEIQRRMLAVTDRGADPAADAGGSGESQPLDPSPVAPRNRALAAVLAVALPAAAFGLYFVLGSPDMPDHPYAERNIGAEIAAREGRLARNEVTQLAARLEKRLQSEPGNADGWVLLGRTYLTISEFAGALAAFRRAMELSDRPRVTADYAEALVLAGGGKMTAEARGLFEDIAAADPLNPKARFYLGLGLAQEGDVRGALQAWVDLKAVSPAGAPWLDTLNKQIADAAAGFGIDPGTVEPSSEALDLAKRLPSARPAGTPDARPPKQPGPSAGDVEAASRMSAAERAQMIRSMVERLAGRLVENPDNEEGWRRLARAYQVLGETKKAADALKRAEALAKTAR